MEVKEFLSMKHGEGETSYAHSTLTKRVISTAKPILEKAIEDLLSEGFSSDVLTVADLGCSFGPNTFSVITTIKRRVEKTCNELGVKQPELQVFLNDLPGNDFNSMFKFFSANYEQLEGERSSSEGKKCFIAGVAGSFYERLFPINTLHFAHCSYSVHWLSQVPPGLTSEVGLPINKGKIYVSNTSPPAVKIAYLQQFQEDFTLFLKLRSKELVPSGLMLLILHGRQDPDPSSIYAWERLAEALGSLVSEGQIEEEKLDSYNVPYYTATCEEVQEIIDNEGSFDTKQLGTFGLDIGYKEEKEMPMPAKGRKVAIDIRRYTEPLISNYFGNEIIEPLYEKLTHLIIDDMIKKPPPETVSISIVLQRKGWK
ncbi:7-methylxanthine methyltransferase ICS1-like isoform X1 [Macadamia integrifolia]|uniref:7-methylxanthine methyltransferase ICS1-like isoform X1 n=1 Tax=Macadamia integrifolia TaxID=60698 RepID=UPI001C4F2810|nr:7-methylxanthine methyltransferase ICS1-like isoform X1 [Macadamia integrifolia]